MVKKFTANCDFGGKKAPVTLYIGNPSPGSHPLQFQGRWLSDNKGGAIPPDIMQSFGKLAEISEKNRVSFDELCAYVIEEIQQTKSVANDVKEATALSSAASKKVTAASAATTPPTKKTAAAAPKASAASPADKEPKDENEE